MSGPSDERVTEWAGGSLGELMTVLSAAALPARIRVFAAGSQDTPAGEVHLLAGGLNDAFAGEARGEEAVAVLQRLTGGRFLIDTRLPDPDTGSLAKPGPAEGDLSQRPLVEIMRYCEEYVLTCTLEVWRGGDQASISYRRGELVATTVGASDAPEKLPEVMGWKEGFFEIALPLPVTPPVPALSKRSTASMAVAGASPGTGPARLPPAERERRKTDPLISVDLAKKGAPAQPAAPPTAEDGRRLPPGPPLPGLPARGATGAPSQAPAAGSKAPSSPAAGPRAPLAGPKPVAPLAAASPRRSGPLPSVPARTAQAPIAAPASAGTATARPASAAAGAAQARRTPPLGVAVPAPAAASPPAARPPATDRAPQSPVAPARARPGATSPRAPLPSLAAKPTAAATAARSLATPAPKIPHKTPAQGSSVTPPPVVTPVASPPSSKTLPVQHRPPSPARPPSAPSPLAAVARTTAASRPSPSEQPESQLPSAVHGALNTATLPASSGPRRTPGDMRRSLTPVRGIEELPVGVELSEDMQDPAAFVDTPPPVPVSRLGSPAQSTPTPVSQANQKAEAPTVRLSTVGLTGTEDLSINVDEPRLRQGKRRTRRGVGHWPLWVHVLLGIALGAAIVAAYSAYYGLPLR